MTLDDAVREIEAKRQYQHEDFGHRDCECCTQARDAEKWNAAIDAILAILARVDTEARVRALVEKWQHEGKRWVMAELPLVDVIGLAVASCADELDAALKGDQ